MLRFLRRSSATSVSAGVKVPLALPVALALVREPADRTAHLDDQHLVFWNADAAQASAEHFSEAAATWHHALAQKPADAKPEWPRLARA